jgi:hypothetical protein
MNALEQPYVFLSSSPSGRLAAGGWLSDKCRFDFVLLESAVKCEGIQWDWRLSK